ncbi:MAG TPA: FAD-dependent oxidoreductase [Longimicrobiales bacterium]|nr:FAD-dependent oxidoreductase [Longimicrobiales bacterium]
MGNSDLEHGAGMIAVVGGGVGGLATGWELAQRGEDVVVLESTGRPGGVIRSERIEGRVLELGPQRARLAAPFRRLVAELDLQDQLLVAPELPLYVWHAGALREVPLSPGAALSSDLLGWRHLIRILLEPLTGGLRAGETAAEYFTRKMGRVPYDRIIAPLFGGLYASDPAAMPARHALAGALRRAGVRRSLLRALLRGARLRGGAPPCSFEGGLRTVTDALAARLGSRLRLDSPVRRLDAAGGGRLRVVLDDGGLLADHVVLAVPAGSAADVLEGLVPRAAERLRRLRYNPLALVHLLSDADLDGLGFQVPFGTGYATRGVTFNRAMFHRPDLYTAFLGGAHHPDVPRLPEAELGRLAAREFRELTGAADARPVHVSRAWMPAWDRSWDSLDGLRLPAGVSVCANWAARPGILGRLSEARRLAERLTGAGR